MLSDGMDVPPAATEVRGGAHRGDVVEQIDRGGRLARRVCAGDGDMCLARVIEGVAAEAHGPRFVCHVPSAGPSERETGDGFAVAGIRCRAGGTAERGVGRDGVSGDAEGYGRDASLGDRDEREAIEQAGLVRGVTEHREGTCRWDGGAVDREVLAAGGAHAAHVLGAVDGHLGGGDRAVRGKLGGVCGGRSRGSRLRRCRRGLRVRPNWR